MYQIAFVCANDGRNNSTFCLMETVLNDLAHERVSVDIHDKRMKNCAQSSCFMDTLDRRAPASADFAHPVDKVSYVNVGEQYGKNNEYRTIARVPFSLPTILSWFLNVSADLVKHRHEKNPLKRLKKKDLKTRIPSQGSRPHTFIYKKPLPESVTFFILVWYGTFLQAGEWTMRNLQRKGNWHKTIFIIDCKKRIEQWHF